MTVTVMEATWLSGINNTQQSMYAVGKDESDCRLYLESKFTGYTKVQDVTFINKGIIDIVGCYSEESEKIGRYFNISEINEMYFTDELYSSF